MEIKLTDLQEQVDNQIEMRIKSICGAEARRVNMLPNGTWRKKMKPVTYSQEVHDLLKLRQDLYNGVDPEAISATINTGEIQYKFEKSK
jgi:hypothetical protein